MAELLPALSSDDDNGKFDDNDDEDDEDEQMDVVFGGLLVSCVCQKASNEFYEQVCPPFMQSVLQFICTFSLVL